MNTSPFKFGVHDITMAVAIRLSKSVCPRCPEH
jgi:hypothetical protein